MAGGQQPLEHRVAAHVLGVQQLLELVEQQAEDTGLGGVQPGHDLTAAESEGLHESRW